MKKENTGCCSMIIWDIVLVIALACTLLPNSIHIVFRILIGFVVGLLFVAIFRVPYLGKIFSIATGMFWALLVWEIFGISSWSFVASDPVWK